jgi:pimeloyl-ACP methyl ester carboxylesterase
MSEQTDQLSPILDTVHCMNLSPADPGGHALAYWRWGELHAPRTLLCVHGLSRVGRDFDVLARALVKSFKGQLNVIAPDVVGRGKSGWLKDPMYYGMPQYASDMITLLARVNAQELSWLGTSMGALIAIVTLGSQGTAPFKLKRLILNDIGPALNADAVKRIGSSFGNAPLFESVQAGADYLRVISSGFGPHTHEQWLSLNEPLFVPHDGQYRLHYDVNIAKPFNAVTPEAAKAGEAILWALYDKLDCNTLLVRGADSDLLTPETAQAMTQRGPRAQLLEFAGIGHAPTFVPPEQIAAVEDFLR